MNTKQNKIEPTDPACFLGAVSCCHSFACQSEIRVDFFADTGHWLLSQGIVGINNVCLIQKPSLNEQSHEE